MYVCHLPSYSSLAKLNTPTLINLFSYLPRPLIIFVASIWTSPIFALPESFKIKVFRSYSKLGCAIGLKCRDVICSISFPCFGLSQCFASSVHPTAASVWWCVVRCPQSGALFHGPLSASLSYSVLENKLKICSLFCWPHREARRQLYAIYYLCCSNKKALFFLPPTLSLFSSLLKNMRTSRAFDIQEKRGSAVNSPPNIQRSGSLLDKHSSSESDLEPTETSWKSHKIFFITQA